MSDASPRNRRPRFSLLNLLLITTVLAMGVALWQQDSRFRPLEARLARLREEVGEVEVADPTKLCVQALDDSLSRSFHFRWRAYVPPGGSGQVVAMVWPAGSKGNKAKRITLRLDEGESSFDFCVSKLPGWSAWNYQLCKTFSPRGGGGSGPPPPWLQDRASISDHFTPDSPPKVAARGAAVELFRYAGQAEDGSPVTVLITAEHLPAGSAKAVSSAGSVPLPVPVPNG